MIIYGRNYWSNFAKILSSTFQLFRKMKLNLYYDFEMSQYDLQIISADYICTFIDMTLLTIYVYS